MHGSPFVDSQHLCSSFHLQVLHFIKVSFIRCQHFVYRFRQYIIPNKILALIYFVSFIPNLAGVILYVVLIDKYGYIIVNLVHNQSSLCLIDEQWTTSYSGFSITDPYDLFLNRLSSLSIYMCLTSYIPIFFCGIRIIHYLQVNRTLLTDPKIQSDINLTLVVQLSGQMRPI
jgi:hypothetical protein